MKKLVIYITSGAFPIPARVTSSVETSIMNFAPYLTSRMEVMVMGRKQNNTPSYKRIAGVTYVNFSASNRTQYIQKVMKYIKNIHRNSSEQIIIQLENCPYFFSPIKKTFKDFPVYLSLHSTTFLQYKNSNLQRKIERALLEADKIIVNSHFMEGYIQKNFFQGSNISKHIIVNHLGVDLDRFTSKWDKVTTRNREKRLNLLGMKGKKIILYVGRLQEIKGVHQLIKAIGLIKKKYPAFMLIIVGGSSYGENKKTRYLQFLRRLAKENEKHIIFVPYVPHHLVHKWYVIADIFVCPSITEEALGLVNIEAMAAGLPIVASNIGGIPEIVRNGQNGILVSVNNEHIDQIHQAILNLLINDRLSQKLGESGRKKAEAYYAWKTVASRLATVYLAE